MLYNALTTLSLACLCVGCAAEAHRVDRHPDSTQWAPLFKPDLSDAAYPDGVWTVEDGVMTASKDQAIWTTRDYENFVLDFEYKAGENANSGVIVYSVDTKNWIPGAVEVQILDDGGEKWAKVPDSWRSGAVFGHVPPSQRVTRPAGAWNRMTITCMGPRVDVTINGTHVTSMDMTRFTSSQTNPDGTKIPPWLSRPKAELPTSGKIGLQGKHGGAPIWFRKIKVRELDR